MPSRPGRLCDKCRRTVPPHQSCPACTAEYLDANKGSRSQPYSSKAHRFGFRRGVLDRDPLCVLCGAVATVADHHPRTRKQLVAAGENPNDPRFGRGLCVPCHNRHTARSPGGGWGTRPRG